MVPATDAGPLMPVRFAPEKSSRLERRRFCSGYSWFEYNGARDARPAPPHAHLEYEAAARALFAACGAVVLKV
jgi:hypothetical protein